MSELKTLQRQASGGNMRGTLAGGVASALIAVAATKGWLDAAIAVAAKYGLSELLAGVVVAGGGTVTSLTPEVVVPAALALLVGMGVNYAVTHWSVARTIQAAYDALPSTYAEYPGDEKPPVANSNINRNPDSAA